MAFRSIPGWKIALPIALIIILLIPFMTWRNFNACDNEGGLRMALTAEGDPVQKVSGQIMGEGASKYRTQDAKIVLYAKTDLWYNTTQETPDGVKMEQLLGLDCSWSIRRVHPGYMYAAFLVDKAYQQPNTIPKIDNTDLPPLPIDGQQVLAWTLWSSVDSTSKSFPVAAWAKNNKLAMGWLNHQITPNEFVPVPLTNRTGLITSYVIPETDEEAYPALFSRSWIHDDALAIIAFTANGNIGEGLTIINALKGQVQSDGKIGFSYNTENDWYHTYYQSGAIAWVGYAFVFYQQKTGDNQSQATAERIAGYLLSLQDLDPTSPGYGSILDAPDLLSYSADQNIIAYFFLRDLGRLTGNVVYTTGADLIKDSLLDHHWDQARGRFKQRIDNSANGLVQVPALGALFLEAIGETSKAQSSLQFAEETYQVSAVGPVSGYAPYEDRSTVWTQGSLQMALAYKRTGNAAKSRAIIEEITKLQDSEGGIPYAMPQATIAGTDEVFREWPGVAGTAWLTIALLDDEGFLGP